jgi:hypothetical protein
MPQFVKFSFAADYVRLIQAHRPETGKLTVWMRPNDRSYEVFATDRRRAPQLVDPYTSKSRQSQTDINSSGTCP